MYAITKLQDKGKSTVVESALIKAGSEQDTLLKHVTKLPKEILEKFFLIKEKKAISDSRLFKPSRQFLNKITSLWSLRGLNPNIISSEMGISKSLYKRVHDEHCYVKQSKFMPKDMGIDELKKIHEFGKQRMYVNDISKALGRTRRQICHILKKLGYMPRTINPNPPRIISSKLEDNVYIMLVEEFAIDVTRQFNLGRFYFDFHVKGTNILVEVHGDYWHCNPTVYTGKKSDFHIKAMRRDFCKKQLSEDFGFIRLVVWEKDLKEDFRERVSRLVKIINERKKDKDIGVI